MTNLEILKRKIELKEQGVILLKDEIRNLQILLALHMIRKYLESKVAQSFDPVLSRKLDCINYMMEG